MTDLAYSASWPHAGHFARNGSGSCSTDSKSLTARNSENGSLQFSQAAPGRLNPAEEPLITPPGLIGCSDTWPDMASLLGFKCYTDARGLWRRHSAHHHRPRHPMRIIEADQPFSIWSVQRERIAHAMRPLGSRPHTPDLEFHEIAFGIPVGAAIEGEKKFDGYVPKLSPYSAISYQHIDYVSSRGCNRPFCGRVRDLTIRPPGFAPARRRRIRSPHKMRDLALRFGFGPPWIPAFHAGYELPPIMVRFAWIVPPSGSGHAAARPR
jgi:hypothetical protein